MAKKEHGRKRRRGGLGRKKSWAGEVISIEIEDKSRWQLGIFMPR